METVKFSGSNETVNNGMQAKSSQNLCRLDLAGAFDGMRKQTFPA